MTTRPTLWRRMWSRLTRSAHPATETNSEAKRPGDGAAQAVPSLERVILLGGRRFVEATEPQNAAQYLYLMRYIKASRLTESLLLADPNADPVAVGTELLGRVLDSGAVLNVLAGTLVPEGVDWTEEVAAASVAYFKGLKGAENIAALQAELVRLLLSFFVVGTESPKTSPSSSVPDPAPTRTPTPTPSTSPLEALATSGASAP